MFGAVEDADWNRLENYKVKLDALPDRARAAEISRIASEDMDSSIVVNLLLMSYPPEERPSVLFEEGDVIADRYRVGKEIGYGGMGVVYEAVQAHTNRRVALKVIHPYLFTGGEAELHLSERFSREIEILGELNHPGIVTIYEADMLEMPGARNTSLFFAMERIDGVTLRQYGEERDLTEREASLLMAQICDAVGYAHEHGIVHRDLKPANVFVREDGSPVVLDFGLANASFDIEERHGTQALSGTPEYMSPEQLEFTNPSNPPNAQVSDVYALGVIAYELITGTRLHAHGRECTLRELRDAILATPEPNVKAQLKNSRVARALARALQRDPQQRYDSAAAFGDALRSAAKPLVSPRAGVLTACICALFVIAGFMLTRAARQAEEARVLSEMDGALVVGDRERGLRLLKEVKTSFSPVAFRSKAAAMMALPGGQVLEKTLLPERVRDTDAVFSADGERYVVAGEGSAVQVHDTDTKALLATLESTPKLEPYRPASRPAGAMVFSPDGKRLAVASESSLHVFLWDISKSMLDGVLYHPSPVTAMDWVSETVLVCGSHNGSIREWRDLPKGDAFADTPAQVLDGVTEQAILALDQCQDDILLAVLDASHVMVHDRLQNENLVTEALPEHGYEGVRFQGNGLALELQGKEPMLVDWRSKSVAFHVDFPKEPLEADWAPWGHGVVVLVEHALVVIDLITEREVTRTKATLGGGLAVSSETGVLYATDRFGLQRWVPKAAHWQYLEKPPVKNTPMAPLSLSQHSSRAAIVTGSTLRIVDPAGVAPEEHVNLDGEKGQRVVLAPDAKGAVVLTDSGDALVYRETGERDWAQAERLAEVRDAVYTADGASLIVSEASGDVKSTGGERWTLESAGTRVALSGLDQFLLTGTNTSDLKLWDARSKELITTLAYPRHEKITRLRLSHDGGRALVLTESRLIVWNLRALNAQLAEQGLAWQDSEGYAEPQEGLALTFKHD